MRAIAFALLCAAPGCQPAPQTRSSPPPTPDHPAIVVSVTSATSSASSSDPAAPLPEALPVVWSHPYDGFEPAFISTPSGHAVLSIEPGGRSAVLLDARTGAVRWTVAAPAKVQWTKPIAEGQLWMIEGYHEPQGSVLSRLDPASGAIVWSRDDLAGEPSIGLAGTGVELFSRGRCKSMLLDPANGKTFGAPMRGRDIEMFGHGDMPPGHRCDDNVVHFGTFGDIAVAAHEPSARKWILEGVDTAGKSRWTLPIGEDRPHGIHFEGDHALLVREDPETVLRVEMTSGRVVWKRVVPEAEACGRKRVYPVIRMGPGWGRKSSKLLVNTCRSASLWDAATGKDQWTRETGGAAAVILGVTPDHPDDRELRFLDLPPAIRWFTPDGNPAGEATLPSSENGVFPFGEMVVVEPEGFESVMGIGRNGAKLWEHRLGKGGGERMGNWFVMLVGRPTRQILISPADGKARSLAQGSPYVLGEVPGAGVFVTTRREPEEIVGLRN